MVGAIEGSDALGFESDLWASANKMRGNMDASEYKHVVLPLVFLKYISDAFEDIHADLVARGRNAERRDEYLAKGVFWVPEKGRWNGIVEKAMDPSIGIIIDDAIISLKALLKANSVFDLIFIDADKNNWEKYDPYYFDNKIEGTFDTIICINVISAVSSKIRKEILNNIQELLNENGKAYLSVPRNTMLKILSAFS